MSKLASLATRAAPIVDALYAATIAAFIALLAYHHFQIITAPAPLEWFEGTMVYFTELFAHGQNPFTFEMQPEAMYVYTPFYNIAVAPLSLIFGNSVELHRVVNAVCIVLCCGLLAISARRSGAKLVDSAAVAALSYAALLFYATPIASGSALGELLFLSAILVPWLLRWSTPSLIASALLGILAFYTKQYFLLSLGIVSVYLFLSVSKLRSVIYAAGSAAILLASLAVTHLTSPYFLVDVYFAVSNTTRIINSWDRLIPQLLVFAQVYAGLLLLTSIAAATSARRALNAGDALRNIQPRILPLKAPLFGDHISYPWTAFALTTAAIVFSLGQNPGQYMSYLYQLMTPFLVLGLCAMKLASGAWRLLIVPVYLFSFATTYDVLPKNFDVTPDAWRQVRETVCASENPYVSGMLVLTVVQCGKPVYHGGHNGYFRSAGNIPAPLRPQGEMHQPDQIWRAYLEDLNESIRTQRFDVLVLSGAARSDDLDRDLVQIHYRRVDRFLLSLSERPGGGQFAITIWRPRTSADSTRPERSNQPQPEQSARRQMP